MLLVVVERVPILLLLFPVYLLSWLSLRLWLWLFFLVFLLRVLRGGFILSHGDFSFTIILNESRFVGFQLGMGMLIV